MEAKRSTESYNICLLVFIATLSSVCIQGSPYAMAYKKAEQNITRALIEMSKDSLIQAFGHDMKRKPSRSFTPHDYMIHVYTRLSRKIEMKQKSRINTVRGIIDKDFGKGALFRLPHQIFHFDVSGIPDREDMLECEFRVLWTPEKLAARLRRYRSVRRGRFYKLILLGIMPNEAFHTQNSTTRASLRVIRLATHTFDLVDRFKKWITFDKLGEFSRILRKSKINVMKLAIYIIELGTGRILAPDQVGFDKKGRRSKDKALLVLFSNDKTKKTDEESTRGRAKRGARRGRKKDRKSYARRRNKALCRRRKMYVNFDDFGWTNWIIAPKGYEAYYCRGSCAFPIPGHLSPTGHAVIQSTISSMDSKFIKPACCIPDKLKSIAMLYLDHNDRVVYQKKDNMVVVSCACR